MSEGGNGIPRWWKEWFSPATVLLFLTAIGTIVSVTWATSSRLTAVEISVAGLKERAAALEATIVTKEWLAREIQFQRETFTRETQYQRETFAPKANVEVVTNRMEEFQRQLNTIESLQREINAKKVTR